MFQRGILMSKKHVIKLFSTKISQVVHHILTFSQITYLKYFSQFDPLTLNLHFILN
jgi:hypothetical protein